MRRWGRAPDAVRPSCQGDVWDKQRELAMLLAAAHSDQQELRRVQGALTTLLAQQWRDGSWPCSRVLRVTDPSSADADALTGQVFAGARRAFSTAHAVAALASLGEGKLARDGSTALLP